MRRYSDIIGNALAHGWGQGGVVFGADEFAAPAGTGCSSAVPYGGQVDPALFQTLLAAQHAVSVGPECGPSAFDQWLPVQQYTIPANTTVTLTATPQALFTPKRLLIPSTIASSLNVRSFTIATRNQFASQGPVPAMAFIETMTYGLMACDTCLPNQPIQIDIENTTDSDVPFVGTILGRMVYPNAPKIHNRMY